MGLPVGLRGTNKQIAVPPYSNGPYTWDQDITFSGTVNIATLNVTGTLTFGDAALDSLILKGRLSTMTAAGSAIDLGATYTYGEAIELRYTVSSWTGIGSSFKALYLRSEADLGGSFGLRCAELYGVMDTSTTTGLSNLQVLYTEMLIKASASNRTLTAGNSMEANISIENQTGTLTITNNIYCLYAKAQTGTGLADYTKVNGIKIAGRDDGTARVFGIGLDISDPEATVCTWTRGISITTASATGIYVSAATQLGINVSLAAITAGDAYSGIRSIVGAAAANNSYGAAGYFETDVTGTQAGTFVYGMGSWININSGTVGAGKYICAQDNGIYEDSGATITNALVIFGMRMEKVLGDTDALTFPFSVNAGNNSGITALFHVGTVDGDLGRVTNAGSDTGLLVPLTYDANGNKTYVKLYTLA